MSVATLDPLLAALIGKLPQPDTEWDAAKRTAWLKMMAMAFDVVYGPTDAPLVLPAFPTVATPAPVLPPASTRPAHVGHKIHIAHDGTVCMADGTPAMPENVDPDDPIFDCRPPAGDFRDLTSIVWADGSTGKADMPPGVSFCGPG